MPTKIVVRQGMDLPIPGAPSDTVEGAPPVGSVAILGDDFPDVRLDARVEEGDSVALGQALLVDARRPEVRFVASSAGRVSSVRRGEGRRLVAVVVEREGEACVEWSPLAADAVRDLGRERTVERLLAAGAWVALRQRPFGGIPDPGTVPDAIFVRAIETDPLAADPAPLMRSRAEDLARGLSALAHLTDGAVFLCTGAGASPGLPEHERVREVQFEGSHPAGLVGTHIHHLCPVSATRRVWYVGVQDVIAIGALLRTGRVEAERVVALAGPFVRRPRQLRTRLGSSTEDLVRGELVDGECRIVSGPVLSGRRALQPAAFLGRYHEQLCALPVAAPGSHRRSGWFVPRASRWLGARRRRARFVPPWRPRPAWTGEPHGVRRAMLPLDLFERVVPLRLPVGLLLRALSAGDLEAAERYGAAELEEEDLALCTFLCPSKLEYGTMLRRTLSEIEAGWA